MGQAVVKLIKTGVTYKCTAPEHITESNKVRNRKVFNTCQVKPKLKPQLGCRGCEYLEVIYE